MNDNARIAQWAIEDLRRRETLAEIQEQIDGLNRFVEDVQRREVALLTERIETLNP
jgi:hypothetical protein